MQDFARHRLAALASAPAEPQLNPTPIEALADTYTGKTEVDRLAIILMHAFGKAEPKEGISQYPASYVATFADMARAVIASAPAGDGVGNRFWLIVREPGMVPRQKGPFRHADTAKVLREFIAANPRAFIDHLTIDSGGTPWVNHGPEVLQMTDGRSMSVGSKHNKRVREAAEEALGRPRAAVGEREAE